MPYIKFEDMEKFDSLVVDLSKLIEHEVDLNYIITCLLHHEVEKEGYNYKNLNRLQGVMDCAGKEFYRTVVAPYEESKAKINGDINIIN
jgi:hypothetical protein